MERLKQSLANPFFLLYLILLVGAVGFGWQMNLAQRSEYFGRLADYYTLRARQGTPSSVARYSALARKYRDASARPWSLRLPRTPEL
jgi:hypothetical protein